MLVEPVICALSACLSVRIKTAKKWYYPSQINTISSFFSVFARTDRQTDRQTDTQTAAHRRMPLTWAPAGVDKGTLAVTFNLGRNLPIT